MSENEFSIERFIELAKKRGENSSGHRHLRFTDPKHLAVTESNTLMSNFSFALEEEYLSGSADKLGEFFDELTKKLRDAKLITDEQDWTDYPYSADPNKPKFTKDALNDLRNTAEEYLKNRRNV